MRTLQTSLQSTQCGKRLFTIRVSYFTSRYDKVHLVSQVIMSAFHLRDPFHDLASENLFITSENIHGTVNEDTHDIN